MTDFTETRSMLKKLAMAHGADTPIGRRCFNILELTDTMPRPPEEWIDYLMPTCPCNTHTAFARSNGRRPTFATCWPRNHRAGGDY